MRCFFAIMANDKVKTLAADIIASLKAQPGAVSWSPIARLHLTLQFLGDISLATVQDLTSRLSQLHFSAFALTIDRLALFPTSMQPSVVALMVKPEHPLENLAQALAHLARQADIELDTRRFKPHLTLGHIKFRPYPQLRDILIPEGLHLPVQEIVLVHSQTSALGQIYLPLSHLRLT